MRLADLPQELVGTSCRPWTPVLRRDNPHGLLALLVTPPPVPLAASALLVEEELAYAETLPPRRRLEWTAGRVCIVQALAALSDGPEGAVPARRAPLLATPRRAVAPPPGVVCSLTHKGRFAAALVAHGRGQRVGVDLEHVDAMDARLAQRILSDAERTVVEGLTSADRVRGVTAHFSLKEAVFKALMPDVQDGLEHNEIEVHGWSPATGPVWQDVEIRVQRELGPSRVTARTLSVGAWVLCTAILEPLDGGAAAPALA